MGHEKHYAVWFPRSSERGSIEAPLRKKTVDRYFPFPRSSERGSIEAVKKRVQRRRALGQFPRSSERGSIEAWTTR